MTLLSLLFILDSLILGKQNILYVTFLYFKVQTNNTFTNLQYSISTGRANLRLACHTRLFEGLFVPLDKCIGAYRYRYI